MLFGFYRRYAHRRRETPRRDRLQPIIQFWKSPTPATLSLHKRLQILPSNEGPMTRGRFAPGRNSSTRKQKPTPQEMAGEKINPGLGMESGYPNSVSRSGLGTNSYSCPNEK